MKLLKCLLIALVSACLIMLIGFGVVGLLWYGVSVVVYDVCLWLGVKASVGWVALGLMTLAVSAVALAAILEDEKK